MKTFSALCLVLALSVPAMLFGDEPGKYILPEPQKVEFIAEASGKATPAGTPRTLRFVEDKCCGDEGYRLEITAEDIVISHATEAGKFYALQSLNQLDC